MRESIQVTGVVVSVMNVGEYDRRVVLLTKERGRITAFARGARRQTSQLLAATNAFVFAEFELYEGRNAYTLVRAQVKHHFMEMAMEMPGVYYGFYFMELADYFGTENMDETDMVNLLFVTFRAILKRKVDLKLIRSIFELRTLVYNGEFAVDMTECRDETALYALQFVATAPLERLYSFTLEEASEREFTRIVRKYLDRSVDRALKSLDILSSVEQV